MSGELIAPTPQHCPGTESEDAGKTSGGYICTYNFKKSKEQHEEQKFWCFVLVEKFTRMFCM